MPRGDRTGPRGMGRATGRGAGYCTGYGTPGYANPVGCGFGFGRGRGYRRMYYGAPFRSQFGYPAYPETFEPAVDEKEFLKRQEEYLKGELEQVKKRLSGYRDDEE